MAEKSYKAVVSSKLSRGYERRWVIVDNETGKVLDDAQGYGYKSAQKAYAGYGYKAKRPVVNGVRTKTEADIQLEQTVRWMKANGILDDLNDLSLYAWKDNCGDPVGARADIIEYLKKSYPDAPYTPAAMFRAWEKSDDIEKRMYRERKSRRARK